MYEPARYLQRYTCNMHGSDILDFVTESVVFSNEAKEVQPIISRKEYN